MRRVAAAILTLLAGTVVSSAGEPSADGSPTVPGAEIVRIGFDALRGWDADDHAAALRTFLKSCRNLVRNTPRTGDAVPHGLADACGGALFEATLVGGQARCADGLRAATQPASRGSPLPEGEGQGEGCVLSG